MVKQRAANKASSSGIQGLIIAAAFIGPGTITTATLVGAQTGYALIWLLVFAVLATYVLQEMAARVGSASGMGLSQAIMTCLPLTWLKIGIGALIIAALGIGNAAYEGGNITGAAMGLSSNFGGDIRLWAATIGSCALVLIISGRYKVVEKVLLGLVLLMSAVFLTLMFFVGINTDLLSKGILLQAPILEHSALALALIGTTIVPYNLFLHAGLSAQAHHSKAAQTAKNTNNSAANQSSSKTSTGNSALFTSICIGGLLTFAVLSSSVSAFFITQTTVEASNIAGQLQPLLGDYASLFFGIGFFAAGLTSAITAPLATAYAISGLFSWQPNLRDKRFAATAILIIVIGTVSATIGMKPIALIMVAQTSNAMLLPISALLLLWVCNKKSLLNERVNSPWNNVFACLVIALVMVIAAMKLFG